MIEPYSPHRVALGGLAESNPGHAMLGRNSKESKAPVELSLPPSLATNLMAKPPAAAAVTKGSPERASSQALQAVSSAMFEAQREKLAQGPGGLLSLEIGCSFVRSALVLAWPGPLFSRSSG